MTDETNDLYGGNTEAKTTEEASEVLSTEENKSVEVDREFTVRPGERILIKVQSEDDEDSDEDEDEVDDEDLETGDDDEEDDDEILDTNVKSEIPLDVLQAEIERRKGQ